MAKTEPLTPEGDQVDEKLTCLGRQGKEENADQEQDNCQRQGQDSVPNLVFSQAQITDQKDQAACQGKNAQDNQQGLIGSPGVKERHDPARY